jgi:uncharacterized membrane protein
MEFVHGAYAWFAAGMAIPLIIHLLHRQRFRRERWGAMQFLLNAIRKTQRRIRLENLILLLIRMLVMGFLAMAIMRPFFKESPLAALSDSNINYVFVIDNSMSMGYKRAKGTQLDMAKTAATDMLDKLTFSSNDTFTLILLNQYPEISATNLLKRDAAKNAVQGVELSDYGTSLVGTFSVIDEVLQKSGNIDKKVYIFTDMQENGWLCQNEEQKKKFDELLKKLSHNDHHYFYIIDVGDEDPQNYGIVSASVQDRVITTRRKVSFDVTLHNYSNMAIRDVPVHMVVNGDRKDVKAATLDPYSSGTVGFDYEFNEAGPHRIKFETTADFLARDDTRYFAVDVRDGIRLLLVNGDPAPSFDDEIMFLQLALDPSREGRRFKVDVKTPDTFPTDELLNYDAVFLCNCKDMTPEKVEKLKEFVKNGGGLFISLGAKVFKDFYNGEFFEEGKGLMPCKLTEIKGHELEKVEQGEEPAVFLDKVRVDHPMFKIYRDPKEQSSLNKIPFAMYWGTEAYEEPHVLAAYNDPIASPCLIEKPFGEGKVILYTSTIDREWNSFFKIAPFVPIVNEMARHLASRPLNNRNVLIGETIMIRLPVEKWAPELRLRHLDPGNWAEVTVPVDKPPKEDRTFLAKYPTNWEAQDPKKPRKAIDLQNRGMKFGGLYRLTHTDFKEETDKPIAYFAVNLGSANLDMTNLELSEGNLKRLLKDGLQTMYPTFKCQFIGEREKGESSVKVIPPASNLWKTILICVLSLLAMESILACIFGLKKE